MKALIWDLDGTLVDSYQVITTVTQKIIAPYVAMTIDDIHQRVIKTSVKDLLEEVAKNHRLSMSNLLETFKSDELFMDVTCYPLIEHVKETLDFLTARGYRHYIYTHRDQTTYAILEHHHLLENFVDIVTSEDGFQRKPDPGALMYLMKKHNLPQTTFYIGDRSLDVLCGQNASIQTIYIGRDKSIKATYNVTSIRDILKLL